MTPQAELNPARQALASVRGVAVAYLSLGFAAAAISLPILVTRHSFPLPAFYQEWLAFALGLAALVPLILHPAERPLRVPQIAAVPAILLAAVIVQAVLGRIAYVEQALIACLYFVWFAALICCASALRESLGLTRVCESLAVALGIAALLSAVVAIVQHFGIDTALAGLATPQVHGRAYANLTQPNLLADYLCLGLASLSFLNARGRFNLVPLVLAAGPMVLALALSQSRSAWAFLGVQLAVSLWLRRKGNETARSNPQIGVSIGYLCGLLFAYLLVGVVDSGALPLDQQLFRTADGVLARIELWQQAWEIFLRSPWLGAGLGQFAYERFWAVIPGEHTASLGLFAHAHNIVLQLLAELGLIATVPLVWLSLRWIIGHLRAAPELEHAWLATVFGVLALHSLVEFPLWHANFLAIAALVLGLGERSVRRPGPGLGLTVLGTAAALGAVTLVTSFIAYRGLERLFVGPQGYALPSVLVRESRHIETRSLFVPYVELAYSGLLRVEPENPEEALGMNERVMRFMPDDHVVYRQALLLAQAGKTARARETLLQAIAVYPSYLPRFTPVLERLAKDQPVLFEPMLEAMRSAPSR